MNWKFWKKDIVENIIDFTDLVEGTGNYGVMREDIVDQFIGTTEYKGFYYIEFKEINRAIGTNGHHDLIKIKILKLESDSMDDKKLKVAYETIKNKTWFVANDSDIWWFSDNQSRRRDDQLKDLIEEAEKEENS